MKIAVFHNFLDNIGGAEIVALSLARELSADIYTTNIDQEKIKKMGYEDVLPKIHSIGHLPRRAPFRQQLALWRFRRLNLREQYDFFIIAGDWAMSGAVNNHPNIWYVHSPLNELWAFTDFIKKEILSFWKKPIYDLWVYFNRRLSLQYSTQVDYWVCNSLNTKQRIAKFYHQDAQVIYPPVKTTECQGGGDGGYYLSVNRLVTHKRLDLQMEAFAKLSKERLVVVASYEKGVAQFEDYKKYIEKIKPDNVEIKHWLTSQELSHLYANCRAFITTAANEDFGLTAVEAMAHGKPVIAPCEGGYPESIISGSTGLLIEQIDAAKLVDAILEINKNLNSNPNFYKEACLARANFFDISRFIEQIRVVINNHYAKNL
jgi:glycosyltransferase involved in cell wall biosynthesis